MTGADAVDPALLDPFLQHPEAAAVLTDFDGTLSPIVTDPQAARPVDGAIEVLDALAGRFAVVAVVSGRPVSFLEPLVPDGVRISGLYGLEASVDGARMEVPGVERWRHVVEDVARRAERDGPDGVHVERKGLALTLHFRARPGVSDAAAGWAESEAQRSGLVLRRAKMSIELHPPVATDKGTAVEELVAGLRSVCFLGDDVGDLPALDALDRLATTGVHAVRVGVRSPEAPPEVLSRADVLVAGPTGALAFLRSLLPQGATA